MSREAIQPSDVATPKAPYSPVVVSGDHVFTAGQVAFDENGDLVGSDVASQTRRALENLRSCLEAAGGTLDDVVKVSTRTSSTWPTSTRTTPSTASSSPSPTRHGRRFEAGSPPGLLVEIEAVARRATRRGRPRGDRDARRGRRRRPSRGRPHALAGVLRPPRAGQPAARQDAQVR